MEATFAVAAIAYAAMVRTCGMYVAATETLPPMPQVRKACISENIRFSGHTVCPVHNGMNAPDFDGIAAALGEGEGCVQ